MDFLGLVNLTTLSRALALISHSRDVELALEDIPLDDPKTFELLSNGETVGVFQLEGAGVTRYIKELKPSSLSDVAAMIALYRPGPMEQITTFIEAKHGRTEPSYPHPALSDILEETYGVIVYQDQVLHIARTFAGYTLGEADIVRKAMGKKIPEIMAQEREKFLKGALQEGYSQELAEEVFALVEPFAGYAFNKAHSVSYGLISYWTAYLKANYPVEYMVALLNSYLGNTEKISGAVNECRRLKIQVNPPSINRSKTDFSIEESEDGSQSVRFGIAAIKNVGAAAVQPVLEAAVKEGPFPSIEQMCRLADMSGLNRKPLESLIKAGALDDFGDRGALLTVVDRVLSLAQSEAKLKASNQTSMFDLFGESVPTPLASIELDDTRTPDREQQDWEEEVLGFALSDKNPLNALAYGGDSETIVFRNQLDPSMDGRKVTLAGQVSSVTHRVTRNQRPFTIATIALMDGTVEVFIWEELQDQTRSLWEERKLVVIVGTVRTREDQLSLSAVSASEYTVSDGSGSEDGSVDVRSTTVEAPSVQLAAPQAQPIEGTTAPVGAETSAVLSPNGSKRLNLRIQETDRPTDDQRLLDDVKRVLLENQGEDEVRLEIASNGVLVTLEWPLVRVDASPELEDQLRRVLGEAGGVKLESSTS